jgi:hypothetical protein
VLGFTYNLKNTATQYQSGADMHFDWGASQFLSKQVMVGLVGYVYKELGCDSGSGDRVGCFQSQVVGIGPQIGFLFPVGDMQGYLNVFATPVLGGQASVSLVGAYGVVGTSLAGTLSGVVTGPGGGTIPFARSDTINDTTWGFGDLIPQFALRWNAGVNNFMCRILYRSGTKATGLEMTLSGFIRTRRIGIVAPRQMSQLGQTRKSSRTGS